MKFILSIVAFLFFNSIIHAQMLKGRPMWSAMNQSTSVITSSGGGVVTLNISLGSSASGVTSTIPPLKYGKKKWYTFDFDDNNTASMYHLSKFLSTKYSDGAGDSISYTAGIALNGRAAYDNAEIGATPGRNAILYPDQLLLIQKGWDMMNHGFYHNIDGSQTGSPEYGIGDDTVRLMGMMDSTIQKRYCYVPNQMIVATNFAGEMNVCAKMGYVAGSSQSQFDQFPVQYTSPHIVSAIPNKFTFVAEYRDFATNGWPDTTNHYPYTSQNSLLGYNMSNGEAYGGIGTHCFGAGCGYNYIGDSAFDAWIQKFRDQCQDSLAFTSRREFWEYQHLRQWVGKKDSTSGNNLFIKVDYSQVPNQRISWSDLSFVLSGSQTINSITCSDSTFFVSFNPTTRLVNIKRRQTVWQKDTTEYQLTLDPERIFAPYNNLENIAVFINGINEGSTQNLTNGESGITPDTLIYDFGRNVNQKISHINIYDANDTFTFKIIGYDQHFKNPQVLVTTNNPNYGVWNSFAVDTSKKYRYLAFVTFSANKEVPPEIQIFSTNVQQQTSFTPRPLHHVTLGKMLGVDAHMYDYQYNPFNTTDRSGIYHPSYDLFKWMGIHRLYSDQNYVEYYQGKYRFNPGHSTTGNWNIDSIIHQIKIDGGIAMPVFDRISNYLINSYPSNQQHNQNVPAFYGSNFTDPASYLAWGKLHFQMALRYGSNPRGLSTSWSKVDTNIEDGWNAANTPLVGLNWLKYIEVDNEPDKTWLNGTGNPNNSYRSGVMYAAEASAVYDGDQGRLGDSVGIKQADKNMIVVQGGTAASNTNYIKSNAFWSEQHRGLNADSTVNMPYDAYQIHNYLTTGNTGGGLNPFAAKMDSVVNELAKICSLFNINGEMMIGEAGYDDSTNSAIYVPAGNGQTAAQRRADWTLQSVLTAARDGVDRYIIYQTFDDNNIQGTYGSSGLAYDNGSGTKIVKPSWYVLKQLDSLFAGYTFSNSLSTYSTGNPAANVDVYYDANNNPLWVCWIPDVNWTYGKQTTLAVGYQFPLTSSGNSYTHAKVYTFSYNSIVPTVQTVSLSGVGYTANIQQTPMFIVPY